MKSNRLLDRVCPSCGKQLKIYKACAIYMPIEANALFFSQQYGGNDSSAFLPRTYISNTEACDICFSTECECGALSFWKLTWHEINYLRNNNEGYVFSWTYNKKIWQEYLDKTTDEILRNKIESTIRFIEKAYPDED